MSGVTKITMFDSGELERETTFVPSYREVRKNESSRDRDSTVVILKPRILYDLDRLPS